MGENTAADNLRKLWEKGLPPDVEKELKKSKALLPTSECLQPHELNALGNDKPLQISGKQLVERVRHVVKCLFCRGLVSSLFPYPVTVSKEKAYQKRKKSLVKCEKCSGKGWYMYDEIHGQPCEACCPHSRGWWKLKKYYNKDNGKYACGAGCGTVISHLPRK